MPGRLPDLSIRGKLLFYLVGVILAFRLTMVYVHDHGNRQTVETTLAIMEQQCGALDEQSARMLAEVRHSMKSSIRENLIRELTISAFLLAIIVTISIAIARTISGPVTRLTSIARKLALGDFSAARQLKTNHQDEVGVLSSAFASMADELRKTQDHLENTIRDMQQAERRQNLFFEQSTDLFGIASYDTTIIYANPAFLKALKYTREHVAGRSYLDFIHPDDLDKSRAAVDALRAGQNLNALEIRYLARDGNARLFTWNIASDPEAQLIYSTGRDITRERERQEEVVRAAAAEQERIAHDLHDSVGQLLTGLAFKAKLVERDLAEGILSAPEKAAELVTLANRASEQVRALARGIDPVELQHGLAPALEYLAVATRSTFGIPCSFDQAIDETGLERATAVHLYRIAQEAVSNAVKHSQARRIDISLVRAASRISLTVSDNGRGLTGGADMCGQGMRIMDYRARLIGGTLDISAAPEGGLRVTCALKI